MLRLLWAIPIIWGVTWQLRAQGYLWTSQIGMSGSPFGDKVAADSSGNVYIIGGFQGIASFGNTNLTTAGDYDVFLAKLDSRGNLNWVKRAGGIGDDVGGDVAVDANGN